VTAEEDWQRIMAADLPGADLRDVDGGGPCREVATQLHLDISDPAGRMGAQSDLSLFPADESPPDFSFHDWVRNAGVGPVSGWSYRRSCWPLRLIVRCRIEDIRRRGELAHGNAHV